MLDILYLNQPQEKILNGMHELFAREEFSEDGISGYTLCKQKIPDRKIMVNYSTWNKQYEIMLKQRIIIPGKIEKSVKKKNSEKHTRPVFKFKISSFGYMLMIQKNRKVNQVLEIFPTIKEFFNNYEIKTEDKKDRIDKRILDAVLLYTLDKFNFEFDRIDRVLIIIIEIDYDQFQIKFGVSLDEEDDVSHYFFNYFLYNLYRLHTDKIFSESLLSTCIEDLDSKEDAELDKESPPEIEKNLFLSPGHCLINTSDAFDDKTLDRIQQLRRDEDNGTLSPKLKKLKVELNKAMREDEAKRREYKTFLDFNKNEMLQQIDPKFIKLLLIEKPESIRDLEEYVTKLN